MFGRCVPGRAGPEEGSHGHRSHCTADRVILLGGLGFALHVLWWLALAALVIWLLGFLIRVGEESSRRWYRW